MLKLMIAEDDINIGSTYFEFLTKDKDIQIVSYTRDGEKTLNDYLEKRPDVLLLDLDMPKMSGLEVLNHLDSYADEKKKCNVIVITGDRKKMHQLHNTSKVYQIIEKPAKYEELLKLIKEISINNDYQNNKKNLFRTLKLKPYSKGTVYLSEAVDIAHCDNSARENISIIYKIISKKHQVPFSRVKSSIRESVKLINRQAPEECLKNIFYSFEKNEEITPKHFLTCATEYLEKISA